MVLLPLPYFFAPPPFQDTSRKTPKNLWLASRGDSQSALIASATFCDIKHKTHKTNKNFLIILFGLAPLAGAPMLPEGSQPPDTAPTHATNPLRVALSPLAIA
jgi:hypothetical protein